MWPADLAIEAQGGVVKTPKGRHLPGPPRVAGLAVWLALGSLAGCPGASPTRSDEGAGGAADGGASAFIYTGVFGWVKLMEIGLYLSPEFDLRYRFDCTKKCSAACMSVRYGLVSESDVFDFLLEYKEYLEWLPETAYERLVASLEYLTSEHSWILAGPSRLDDGQCDPVEPVWPFDAATTGCASSETDEDCVGFDPTEPLPDGAWDPFGGQCDPPEEPEECPLTEADCLDLIPCTDDILIGDGPDCECFNPIDEHHCLIGGACYELGEARPGAQCQACDPSVSQTGWTSSAPGIECEPPNKCFLDAACGDGQLLGSCVSAGWNDCGEHDWICKRWACDGDAPGDGCVETPEDEGTPCTDDGIPCTDDVCDQLGACEHPPDPDSCLIEGICYAPGESNPAELCEECQPAISDVSWSPAAAGTWCGDCGECDGAGACELDLSDPECAQCSQCLDCPHCDRPVCVGGAVQTTSWDQDQQACVHSEEPVCPSEVLNSQAYCDAGRAVRFSCAAGAPCAEAIVDDCAAREEGCVEPQGADAFCGCCSTADCPGAGLPICTPDGVYERTYACLGSQCAAVTETLCGGP